MLTLIRPHAVVCTPADSRSPKRNGPGAGGNPGPFRHGQHSIPWQHDRLVDEAATVF